MTGFLHDLHDMAWCPDCGERSDLCQCAITAYAAEHMIAIVWLDYLQAYDWDWNAVGMFTDEDSAQ